MGRLIDADDAISVISNHHFDDDKNDFDLLIHNLCKEIKQIPTTYDVEAAVAELENFEMWKELLIYDLSHREREIIEKAISIVRGKE